MNPVAANLGKLRSLLNESWKIDSLAMQLVSSSSWRTTVILKRGNEDLVLQSEDQEFFEFCVSQRPSLDVNGAAAYRHIADLNRYYDELEFLTADAERKRKEAIQRRVVGQVRLDFAPESLIIEFLKSRQWADSRFLPLKTQYFDVQTNIVFSSKEAVEAQERVRQKFPLSVRYANRIGEVLLKAFPPIEDPVKGYLRFADANRVNIGEVFKQLIEESRYTDDVLARLSRDGAVNGDIGLRYLIDIYRRYVDWVQPLLTVLSDAICMVEGKPAHDPKLGISKRVDIIRHSGYLDIVDCFEPRIRHVASHNGVSCNQQPGVVHFSGVDSHGDRLFDDFELSFVDVSDKTRDFTQGFIPGIFAAFGMQQQVHLFSIVTSGEYQKLLLLIGNEAA